MKSTTLSCQFNHHDLKCSHNDSILINEIMPYKHMYKVPLRKKPCVATTLINYIHWNLHNYLDSDNGYHIHNIMNGFEVSPLM